jgi:hypothetical protein
MRLVTIWWSEKTTYQGSLEHSEFRRACFSPEGETTELLLGSTIKSYGCAMAAKQIGYEVLV